MTYPVINNNSKLYTKKRIRVGYTSLNVWDPETGALENSTVVNNGILLTVDANGALGLRMTESSLETLLDEAHKRGEAIPDCKDYVLNIPLNLMFTALTDSTDPVEQTKANEDFLKHFVELYTRQLAYLDANYGKGTRKEERNHD